MESSEAPFLSCNKVNTFESVLQPRSPCHIPLSKPHLPWNHSSQVLRTPTPAPFSWWVLSKSVLQNLLYCEIDKNIYTVISSSDYAAPVLNPAPVENAADKYMSIAPTKIGVSDDPYAIPELKNNITNEDPYVVQNKAYYIVPAQADIWMAFTAPFNVKNIYIMETRAEDDLMVDAKAVEEDYKNNPSKYPEYTLENPFTWREAMLKAQARHNADFASFFGVAMA